MRNNLLKLTILSVIAISGTVLADSKSNFLRGLDGDEKEGRKLPKFYAENATIGYKSDLGCGACIRGGYIYCIPGEEGSDPSTWPVGLKPACCKDSASCPQVSNTAYVCSSSYADTMLAKALCPFKKASCGTNSTVIDFAKTGEQQNINITLEIGETCHFEVRAECGLPMFKPNDTAGFDIESVEYDEDDLVTPLPITQAKEDDEKPVAMES